MKKAIIVSMKGLSDSGGVERVMLYAARVFESMGYRVLVLDRDRLRASAIGRLFRPLFATRFGFVFEALATSTLAMALKSPSDIVVANGYSAPLARADLLFAHGSMHGFVLATASGRRWRRLFLGPEELMEACAGRLARHILAVSRRAAREWQRYYGAPSQRIKVLQNCVDDGRFSPCAERNGIKTGRSGDIRVLFVARVSQMKGIDRLLKLAERVVERDIHFIVATPNHENCEGLFERRNIEVRVGVSLAEMPELYRSCDVLFLPSRYEGFEMVSLEALACGTPVVGSDVGGIAELSRAGFPGVYAVDSDDAEASLAALGAAARAFSRPADKERLHERVARDYGLKPWGGRLAAIVEELDA